MAVTIGRGSKSNFHINSALNQSELRQLQRALAGAATLENRVNTIIGIMKTSAEPARAQMQSDSPVDTGVLSNSFKSRKLLRVPKGVFGIRVGAARGSKLAGWRAHFTELGTKHHPAQPFIKKAIQKHEAGILQSLTRNLRNLLKTLT
jgi:HK97 gp10 family phage protein